MLFESRVQLYNNPSCNFSVLSVVDVVIPSAVRLDDPKRQFDCIEDALGVLFFKEPIYKVVSSFAFVFWIARSGQLKHSVFATEDLSQLEVDTLNFLRV